MSESHQPGPAGEGASAKPPGISKAIDVAAGLVFREGRLLITRRRDDQHLGGLWEFPGGKRHADETFEKCLRRELIEELAIEVRVGELLESLTHSYPEKTVHLKFFRCEITRGEPRPIACQELAWIEKSQLKAYVFPAADAQLLGRLETNPLWWL
jgi:mutator protein MutT